jgi:NADH-quinone oxidoreductase subunit M
MNGAMLQMFSHGIITGAMFLLVGVLYERTHTRELSAFGGLGARVPVYAGFLIFFSLGSLGLPGLSGFVAEFLSLIGAFGVWRWQTMVSVLGIIVAAAYMLKVIRQVLLGDVNEKWRSIADMTLREKISLTPLMLIALAVGVYPLLILNIQDGALRELIAHVLGN